MSSPLDRIEAELRACLPRYRELNSPLWDALHKGLALVNVAKAAEQYVAAEQADEDALGELLGPIEDDEHDERLRDAQKETNRAAGEAYDALREALAVLDEKAGGE